MKNYKPVMLVILDGWGYQENPSHNAIASANTPVWDQLWNNMPHMLLDASGAGVGLPMGQMGNSEVGHMHIGAGRVVHQDLTRINHAIEQEHLHHNQNLQALIEHLNNHEKNLHIAGLLSPGGVHSHEAHLHALLAVIAPKLKQSIYLHCFLDGRDTPPQSALDSVKRVQNQLKKYTNTHIASLCGRFYAMDRDSRWERTQAAYELIVNGIAEHSFDDPLKAIAHFYNQGINDEFVPPTRIGERAILNDGDGFLFTNFRSDRARQLTQSLTELEFSAFERDRVPKCINFVSMTRYSDAMLNDVLFPKQQIANTLGEVIAQQGLSQLRIAETEKYAHVTFFFNGGIESVLPNEDRILIHSPKIATYDLQPEMSAPELTLALENAIESGAYDFIVCNYANADMVGHTGNMQATIDAIECLDSCLARLQHALEKAGGCMFITADHGNAEQMFDDSTGQAHTAHTSQPVPFLFVGNGWKFNESKGQLIDIAPTILTVLGIEPPQEMTGCIRLEKP
jgi:2,3-bisphosphoglycerate-independent phosphoglycerate mutase